ncbi:DNA replication factor Cdt1 [Syngnathus scovelli]|uniref:DNA replication factor Cdt1 n=1 Tax=Syngnathus scovelli TaxID=161590 RepID=UPI002110E346|nr:DNA replication factor Cdt1 [Syngnathus scovelli]
MAEGESYVVFQSDRIRDWQRKMAVGGFTPHSQGGADVWAWFIRFRGKIVCSSCYHNRPARWAFIRLGFDSRLLKFSQGLLIMSQALVTDFFSRRKKRTADSVKPSPAAAAAAGGAAGRGSSKSSAVKTRAVASSSSNEDLFSKSSPSQVRDDLLPIVDAVASLPKGTSDLCKKPKDNPPTARIPKRTSPNAKLGTDAVLGSTGHRAARKRQMEVCSLDTMKVQAKTTKLSRKKRIPAHPNEQAHCGETMTSHNPLLGRLKKQADDSGTTCVSPSSVSSSVAVSWAAVTRAKELAAKAKKAKEKDSKDEKLLQFEERVHQPAYQKYHNLAQDTPPGLSLPYHFKVLAEMFRNMDTVVAMLFNRLETATLAKVKKGVQDMMHRRFEEHHIGQMKTVFPEAYAFRQEKNIPTYNNCIKKSSYQLTVEPVLFCGQKEGRPALTASDLLERRRIFHRKLLSIVKQHHKLFLSSLKPPLCVPEDKLTRWHPNFNVDTVPAVQASLLPQPPRVDKLATAQEVLDKAQSLITPKMEKALVSLVVEKAGDKKETSPQNVTREQTSASLCIPKVLNGVSQSLLDRIRAKEAQKLQAAMTRSPSQEERISMMSRLGELARILRNVFVSEQKQALNMEVLCKRMVTSSRSAFTSGEMEKHIRLLAELNPQWLSIHPVRKDLYLKLNKHLDLSVILDKLTCNLGQEAKF